MIKRKNDYCFNYRLLSSIKKETKPKIGMFWNKATKGTATPPSREINKENNSAGLLKYFPRCASL